MDERLKFRTKVLGAMKELTRENVEEIKFLLKGQVGQGILENIQTSLQLYEELEKLRWISSNSLENLYNLLNGIKRGDIVSLLQNDKTESHSCPIVPDFSRSVAADQPIDRKVLDEIANNIAGDWKRLGRYLDLSEAKIDQIDEDYRKTYEKGLQTLALWSKSATSLDQSTSWKKLKEALAGLPRQDIIRLIEKNFPHVNKATARPAAVLAPTPVSPASHPGYMQASSVTDESALCTVLDSTSLAFGHQNGDEIGTEAPSLAYPNGDAGTVMITYEK